MVHLSIALYRPRGYPQLCSLWHTPSPPAPAPQPASSKWHPKMQAHWGGLEGTQVVCSPQGVPTPPHLLTYGPMWSTLASPQAWLSVPGPAEGTPGSRKSCDIMATQGHGCRWARGSPQRNGHWGFSLGVFAGEGLPIQSLEGRVPARGPTSYRVWFGTLPHHCPVGPGLSQLCPQPRTQNPLPVYLSTMSAVQGRGKGAVPSGAGQIRGEPLTPLNQALQK